MDRHKRPLYRLLLPVLLLFFSFPSSALPERIRLLHVNDFHGYATAYTPPGSDTAMGGAACLAAKIDLLRAEVPSLLLAGGDMIQGHNWANLFKGRSVVELMNAMGFHAMVVGNHEFDFGVPVLKERIREARFSVLGANVVGLEELQPYVVLDVGGVRVGIIGVVTDETPVVTRPLNVAGLLFLPPGREVARLVPEVRKKADVIVLLSHVGFEGDTALASAVEGIDVIVGSHTHRRVEREVGSGRTLVVQAWEHGKALGVVDLTVEEGRVVSASGRLEEIHDQEPCRSHPVARLVERYERLAGEILREEIGEAMVDLEARGVRARETNLGNLVADVLRLETGAEVAFTNGGGIRADIRKGPVRLGDLLTALPFENTIVTLRLTGRQLREVLEHSVADGEEGGRFLQVSGLAFTYSRSRVKGRKVGEITIGGAPVDPDRLYLAATNDFLAAGGDGYAMLARAAALPGGSVPTGRSLTGAVADHIRSLKRVAPVVEGRIREGEERGHRSQKGLLDRAAVRYNLSCNR